MGSASIQFLLFALAVIVVFNLRRSVSWRQGILLLANLAFLNFFSRNAISFLPLFGFLLFGYVGLQVIQKEGRIPLWPFITATVALFVWLKKYTFLPSFTYLEFSYLTIGLSYIFFRVLHLMIEARDGNIPHRIGPVTYLNYTLNFTTLVSGPIQRYEDFAGSQLAPIPAPLTPGVIGRSIERIIVGLFKVDVLSVLLSTLHQEFLSASTGVGSFHEHVAAAALTAASYALYLYCNFSGYIDVMIGVARLLRLELPENFDRPFAADNFINFWSRWHITLSTWLKTYVYNPLLVASMRRWPSARVEPFLGVMAFFFTFFLIGLWHGQTSVFIFFGVLQGLGVSVVKLYQILMSRTFGRKEYKKLAAGPVYVAVSRGLTFTWFAFTLVWFWSNWSQIGRVAYNVGLPAMSVAWAVVFVGATVILALWEAMRKWAVSLKWDSTPVFASRYLRAAWGTALAVIIVAVLSLLNAPAPDIVYKAF